MNALELTQRAAQLRQAAERLEELARKKAELEKDVGEVDTYLNSILHSGHLGPPGPPDPAPPYVFQGLPPLPPHVDVPEGAGILQQRKIHVLAFLGRERMKRGTLFERLEEARQAPRDADQLSVMLSKMKSDDLISQDENGYWFVPENPNVHHLGSRG